MNLLGDFGGGGVFLALGRAGGAGARAGDGGGAGGGRRDRRRHRRPHHDDPRHARAGAWQRPARGQPARHRGAVLRRLPLRRRAVPRRRARWRSSSTPRCWRAWALAGDETLPGPRRARAVGRPCASGSPRRSPAAPATSGGRSSPAPMPAWRRSGRCWRRPRDEHNRERGVFVEVDGTVQPAVAPRFSVTPGSVGSRAAGRPAQRRDPRRARPLNLLQRSAPRKSRVSGGGSRGRAGRRSARRSAGARGWPARAARWPR